MPAATWVAGAGASLLLVAACVVVVGAWSEISPEVKLLGLLAANALVAVAASMARRPVPHVARVLAHLAATLAIPSSLIAMTVARQSWPVAITVGGAVGVLACGAQHRRWQAPLLVIAAEAAAILGLTRLTPRGIRRDKRCPRRKS